MALVSKFLHALLSTMSGTNRYDVIKASSMLPRTVFVLAINDLMTSVCCALRISTTKGFTFDPEVGG